MKSLFHLTGSVGPTYGRRASAVAGPTVWNSLPEDMRDPEISEDSYLAMPTMHSLNEL